jgi:hypothetical protein
MSLVIHFGKQETKYIVNHSIPVEDWKSILDDISKLNIWSEVSTDKSYKSYNFDSLIYEFDHESKTGTCYTKLISDIDMMHWKKFSALSYVAQIKEINESEFLPVNKYYNVHEVTRSSLTNDRLSVIFEHKPEDDIYELKIIYAEGVQPLDDDFALFGLVDKYSTVKIE